MPNPTLQLGISRTTLFDLLMSPDTSWFAIIHDRLGPLVTRRYSLYRTQRIRFPQALYLEFCSEQEARLFAEQATTEADPITSSQQWTDGGGKNTAMAEDDDDGSMSSDGSPCLTASSDDVDFTSLDRGPSTSGCRQSEVLDYVLDQVNRANAGIDTLLTRPSDPCASTNLIGKLREIARPLADVMADRLPPLDLAVQPSKEEEDAEPDCREQTLKHPHRFNLPWEDHSLLLRIDYPGRYASAHEPEAFRIQRQQYQSSTSDFTCQSYGEGEPDGQLALNQEVKSPSEGPLKTRDSSQAPEFIADMLPSFDGDAVNYSIWEIKTEVVYYAYTDPIWRRSVLLSVPLRLTGAAAEWVLTRWKALNSISAREGRTLTWELMKEDLRRYFRLPRYGLEREVEASSRDIREQAPRYLYRKMAFDQTSLAPDRRIHEVLSQNVPTTLPSHHSTSVEEAARTVTSQGEYGRAKRLMLDR